MEAQVISYDAGTVQFQVPFDRYRIAPDKADGIYNIEPDDSVIASIRMKRGLGVIEGIYVNGISLESSSNGAAMEEARAAREKGTNDTSDRKRIVESGMVPPKEE